MKKLFLISFLIIIFIFNISCSSKKNNSENNNINSPESLYELAILELDNKNYDLAEVKFNDIEKQYPLSNEAIQAQIMLAFLEYLKLNYEEAIFKFNRIINLYPSHKNIDYVYYMRAMCYFEQIDNEYLDGNNNTKALENFNQIVNRFPNSEYARDSEQKIIFVKENMAAKHMNIGLFYSNQKKYLAAMKRYKNVIDEHPTSKFIPEALYRLVEIYYSLGMIEDAKKTASVIGYNYPNSKWYAYSYNLVGEKDNKTSEKKSFFSKITNLLSKEDE